MNNNDTINRDDFMSFFRNTEKLNELSPDDRIEIFRTILLGSNDLTFELLNEILNDYSVENLSIIQTDNGKK
jgi:hypothetical protein